MANKKFLLGILVMALVFGMTVIGCDDGSGGGGSGDPDLTGTITISPTTNVTIGTELTATYSGSETVSYQWKNGTDDVGTNSNKYTPDTAGSYTVIVSASGYKSKTSATVTINVILTGTTWERIKINQGEAVTTFFRFTTATDCVFGMSWTNTYISMPCTYTVSGNTVTFSGDGLADTGTINGNKLTFSDGGVFTKK